MSHAPSSHVLLMPNLNHLTHGISNLVSLITKTKLGLSHVSNYLLDNESLPDDLIDRFNGYELSWP
jgi:hypothetical protein